jgi:hypothetical protein
MKKFYVQYGIGMAKYVVNHHDGIKKHDDGSSFYDIELFKNKKKLKEFVDNLKKEGYTER